MKPISISYICLILTLAGCLYGMEAPTEAVKILAKKYHADISDIIDEAREDIEQLREDLFNDLKAAQEKHKKRGHLEHVNAYDPFISFFNDEQEVVKDVFGNVSETPQKRKAALLPNTNALPTDGKKHLDKYLADIKEHIQKSINSGDKDKRNLIKKLQSQIKKLTRSNELDKAQAVADYIHFIDAQNDIRTALATYLPQTSLPNCELYLSFNINSIRKGKKGLFIEDLSDHEQIVPISKGLHIDKGMKQEALRFNEMASLSIPIPATLKEAKSITLAAWIYIEKLPDKHQRTIISNTFSNWEMQIENKKLLVEGTQSPQSKTVFTNDTWYHVLWSYDDESQKHSIYVNGTLEASKTGRAITCSSANICIGDRSGNPCGPWLGMIDEVMIFSRALKPDEIEQIAK